MGELSGASLRDTIMKIGRMAKVTETIGIRPTRMFLRRDMADAVNRLIRCQDPYYKAAYLAVERFNKRGGV